MQDPKGLLAYVEVNATIIAYNVHDIVDWEQIANSFDKMPKPLKDFAESEFNYSLWFSDRA